MTEAMWLVCTDPRLMLQFLLRNKADECNLRLFACACTRRVWEPVWRLGRNQSDRATVEAIEQLAAGPGGSDQLAAIRKTASQEVELLACDSAIGAAWWAIEELPMAMPEWRDETVPQANVLRQIFGNPFNRTTQE
jgi:hypothetical protein